MHVEVSNISKKYKGKQVLNGVSFSADSGSCIGILGRNGTGKSTLLSILAGVLTRDGGTFTCDDKDLFKDSRMRSAMVGYVPQGTPLIEELTAKDNLLLWYSREELKKELSSGILNLLGIHEFIGVTVSKMSGGMKKRLSIGCAVAKRPPILLLDEPTAALDLPCKEDIASYLKKYKQSGGVLILTTHDVMELNLCDRWYIIKNGLLEEFTFNGDVSTLVKQL